MACIHGAGTACIPCARIALRAQVERETPPSMRRWPRLETQQKRPSKPSVSRSRSGVVIIGGAK